MTSHDLMAQEMALVGPGKVRVSRTGIAVFNSRWPGSTLRDSRTYWWQFDRSGDLVDTDCPEQDDGPAAAALAEDCKAWLGLRDYFQTDPRGAEVTCRDCGDSTCERDSPDGETCPDCFDRAGGF